MNKPAGDSLEAGRQALRRRAWQDAFDLLSEAEAAGGLSAEDLEGLAEAAWATGRPDASIDARQRAYAAHVEQGNKQGAALMAMLLAFDYFAIKQDLAVATGWRSSAERHLDGEPECVAHGHLAYSYAFLALFVGGAPELALREAGRMSDIGTRLGDRDLELLGLHMQGQALVRLGRVAEGMALIDQAMAAAVGGDLGPWTASIVFCQTIGFCQLLADYRRAGEWTEVADRCGARQGIVPTSGDCRVHRAGILQLRGGGGQAEAEARRGCDECQKDNPYHVGGGLYEIGEIHLRRGDLAGAEEAFERAYELGWTLQPGLALLRLAQGQVEAATSVASQALAAESDPLRRTWLLPAQVEIAIAAGNLESARSAASELEAMAETFGTPGLRASAACARGAVQLADGDAPEAVDSLRAGWRLWQEVEAPYEAAKARMLLAAAHRTQGDGESARLELRAARSAFERLGAEPDVRRTSELLEEVEVARTPAPPPGVTRTFMFPDIVRSTDLVEAIGDEAWADLLRWHDDTLSRLFAAHGGEEVKQVGDGFFVAFEGSGLANRLRHGHSADVDRAPP